MLKNRGSLLTSACWTKCFIWATWGLLLTPNTKLPTLPRVTSLPPCVLVLIHTSCSPRTQNICLPWFIWCRPKTSGLGSLSPSGTVINVTTGTSTTYFMTLFMTLTACPSIRLCSPSLIAFTAIIPLFV